MKVLIQVDYPEPLASTGYISIPQSQAMREISSITQQQQGDDKGIHRLGDAVLLLSLDKSLPVLSRIVDLCRSASISYRVAYLEDFEWIEFNRA
jgi:hypothetical protein